MLRESTEYSGEDRHSKYNENDISNEDEETGKKGEDGSRLWAVGMSIVVIKVKEISIDKHCKHINSEDSVHEAEELLNCAVLAIRQ